MKPGYTVYEGYCETNFNAVVMSNFSALNEVGYWRTSDAKLIASTQGDCLVAIFRIKPKTN